MVGAGLIFLGILPTAARILTFSALPLDLIGVIVNERTPSNSVCLIRCDYLSKKDSIFQPGEKAFDFAEIKEILQGCVIIKNLVTNKQEYLTFLKNRPLGRHPPPLPSPNIMAKSSDTITIDIPKETVNHYSQNFLDLLHSAFATPRYRKEKNGEKIIEGFEISRIKKDSIIGQLGFKDGDVILDVSGEPLDSLETVMRLLGQIQTMSQAKLTVQRSGQKLNFIFSKK